MKMDISTTRFPVAVLGEDAQGLYTELYGEDGGRFTAILRSSPEEIAVISRMIAYLKERKEA